MLGSVEDNLFFCRLLGDERLRHDILWALGFSGRTVCIEAICAQMHSQDPLTRKLAFEAFAGITGIDTSDDAFVDLEGEEEPEAEEEVEVEDEPEDEEEAGDDEDSEDEHDKSDASLPAFEDDDLDADLVLEAAWDLPLPKADAVFAWREERSRGFSPAEQYLCGKKWSVEAAVEAMKTGSMRRRHVIAAWLKISSRGKRCVATCAFSSKQERDLFAFGGDGAGRG